MAVPTFLHEFSSPVAAAKLWKAGIIDAHIIIPKIAPQIIESIELEGDGGAGTIKTFKFTQAVKEASLVKNRVDVLDQDSYVYKYSVVEGNDKFESNSFQVKLEASGDGGSICKISGEFKTKGDGVPNEEEIKAVEEGIVKMFKAVEGYLIANPNAYP